MSITSMLKKIFYKAILRIRFYCNVGTGIMSLSN